MLSSFLKKEGRIKKQLLILFKFLSNSHWTLVDVFLAKSLKLFRLYLFTQAGNSDHAPIIAQPALTLQFFSDRPLFQRYFCAENISIYSIITITFTFNAKR